MGTVLVSPELEAAPKTVFVLWTLLISPPEGPTKLPPCPALCALPGLSQPAHVRERQQALKQPTCSFRNARAFGLKDNIRTH